MPALLMTCLMLGSPWLIACSSSSKTAGADVADTGQAAPPTTFEFSPERYPDVYAAAIEVLREHGFRIARNDYRFGTITTYPRESATLAEFWLDDATTTSQGASDTLNAHQRTARIRVEGFDITQPLQIAIDQDAGPPMYVLTIEVAIERLQNPDRYLTSSVSGRSTASYGETPSHLRPRGINGPFAQELSRDVLLESRLLESILAAMVTDLPQPTEPADSGPAEPEPSPVADGQP